MKVLIVDDDPNLAFVLSEVLSRAGHEATVCNDGVEAVLAVRTGRPDVALVDYKMPGFQGDLTGRMLRRACPTMKVIGMSGYDDVPNDWADVFVPKVDLLHRLVPLVEELG